MNETDIWAIIKAEDRFVYCCNTRRFIRYSEVPAEAERVQQMNERAFAEAADRARRAGLTVWTW